MTIETYRLTKSQKYLALGLALALIALGAAALWYLDTSAPQGGVEVTKIEGLPEGATVEVVDSVDSRLFDSTPRPALERALPQGTTPETIYAAMLKNRAEAVAMIKENPALMSQWIGLGAVHKQAGDYEGARIYWTYVATVNPRNLAVHWNLGNLYAYYVKDSAKAEASFTKAIAIDPAFIPAYLELYLIRKESGKTELAIEALSSGIAKNPADIDLRIALARHYRDAKDAAAARAAYDGAITAAEKAGDASLASQLRAEKAAL
jgi:tetratricopeptide (TPR) repeat protein